MTRRQREGKGGKDHHGCKPGCFICHPEKNSAAGREPTRQEMQRDLLDAGWDGLLRHASRTSFAFLKDEPDIYGGGN